ncbi:alpha/beta hydrolase [Herbaspirillum autotrophicum]|uniref:alpha/beta hydrolase n=1 Tax=Herbaspirillum autotrophicum TaxID=180195 RepID=UPI00067BF119|nr:alpha/beta hydrolase [Herbaspirillum autotrophicum]
MRCNEGFSSHNRHGPLLRRRHVSLRAWLLRAVAGTLLLSTLLAGCTTPAIRPETLAGPAHLQRTQIAAGDFVLTAFYRLPHPDQPLTIYIEGDGLAWRSRSEPSDDPTPRQMTGLTLAAADPGSNVIYLARPCQFTPMAANPRCQVDYWTGKRFSEEVVASMNLAVSHFARQAPGQAIHLAGYSGGGAVAVLIAARRNDIASLRTVAGNLDHAAVNRLHRVSHMPASLNPINYAQQVANIPQLHFSGSDDKVVPAAIARDFAVAAAGNCTRTRVVPGLTHTGDWAAQWPALLAVTPACQ